MTGPRIILATAGSLGDLHPVLAVGQALLARGARPVLAVPFDQDAKCRDAGLEAESSLPSYEDLGKATAHATGLSEDEIFRKIVMNAHLLINQLYLPTLRESTDKLLDIASGADLIVGGTTSL